MNSTIISPHIYFTKNQHITSTAYQDIIYKIRIPIKLSYQTSTHNQPTHTEEITATEHHKDQNHQNTLNLYGYTVNRPRSNHTETQPSRIQNREINNHNNFSKSANNSEPIKIPNRPTI
jgi:hypothetical protein